MAINNFTFFSPNGNDFPVTANADGKLYMMLTGMEYGALKVKHWTNPLNTALNRVYTNTSIIIGGRYFELHDHSITLQPTATNYIHAVIDLSTPLNPVTLTVEQSNSTNTTDINNQSGILKVCFDTVVTSGSAVTSSALRTQVTKFDTVQANDLVTVGDIPWTDIPGNPLRGRYRKDGDFVTIEWNFTSSGNFDIAIGTLPSNVAPAKRLFTMAYLTGTTPNFKGVQINASTGGSAGLITLFGAQNGNSFAGQFTYSLN